MELLVKARSFYEWPADRGAGESQQTILTLEADVAGRMQALNEENAHRIVAKVSEWAGNRKHYKIVQAPPDVRVRMLNSLQLFNAPDAPANAIDALSSLPGISLVIASKIFRFCRPTVGAAVDRHTSYFFNSLAFVTPEGHRDQTTNFRREWLNGPDTTSRLAIYPKASYTYTRNRDEFVIVYLPRLRSIANTLNAIPAPYQCAATGGQKNWRPTDVEMAAYYWGACNAPR
ncbi:MAG: hypothetical protein A2Z73_01465 [Deltaproteobacteria bacterium RBG_13_60_28]|nr:MAG: hypothetical protein A2Z73_01465 [Deltaproteobacteria bacterium RBG_13_60_28]